MYREVPYKTLQLVGTGYRNKLFLQVVVPVLVPVYPVPVIVVPGYRCVHAGTFRDFKSKFDNW